MERVIPDVATDAVLLRGSKVWEMRITCPHCGEQHIHGGGKQLTQNSYGHRLSHCRKRAENCPGYNLIPSANEPRRE